MVEFGAELTFHTLESYTVRTLFHSFSVTLLNFTVSVLNSPFGVM